MGGESPSAANGDAIYSSLQGSMDERASRLNVAIQGYPGTWPNGPWAWQVPLVPMATMGLSAVVVRRGVYPVFLQRSGDNL